MDHNIVLLSLERQYWLNNLLHCRKIFGEEWNITFTRWIVEKESVGTEAEKVIARHGSTLHSSIITTRVGLALLCCNRIMKVWLHVTYATQSLLCYMFLKVKACLQLTTKQALVLSKWAIFKRITDLRKHNASSFTLALIHVMRARRVITAAWKKSRLCSLTATMSSGIAGVLQCSSVYEVWLDVLT